MEEIIIQYPLTKRLKEDLAETNWISLSEQPPPPEVLKMVGKFIHNYCR